MLIRDVSSPLNSKISIEVKKLTNTRESLMDYEKIANVNCINFIKLRKRKTASKKCYFLKLKRQISTVGVAANTMIKHTQKRNLPFVCATEAHALEFQDIIMEFGHSRGYMWQG